MIRLTFVPPEGDSVWDDWIEECEKEIQLLLAAGGGKVKTDLYKAPRDRLLAATEGKCAYCELILGPGQRKGDVEHYRPKGRIRRLDGTVVRISSGDQMVPHPGYYWLAYDWQNLLPACIACNRRAMDDGTETMTGKADIFPVLDDVWATTPAELAHEQPALLNPWIDDPREHLLFHGETGVVGSRTPRGEATIDLLGLNREPLLDARRRACTEVKYLFRSLKVDLGDGRGARPEDRELLDAIRFGRAEFAAVKVQALRNARKAWLADLDELVPGEP